MKGRIHTLQDEIKMIEDVLDTMTGPMLDFALDELRNLRFEKDLLKKEEQKNNKQQLVINQQIEEPAY